MSSDEVVGTGGQFAVAVGDVAHRVRYPSDSDVPVADSDVGVVVRGLREVGEAVDERDRVGEPVEGQLALERTVALDPGREIGHDQHSSLFERSRKSTPTREYVVELVYRPLAHLLVLVLLPLRVPPPAVVIAGFGFGLGAAIEIVRGELVVAAVLIIVKTVLDGADGALARAGGRVTAFGRYLDSDCDLIVNAALFAAVGFAAGAPIAAALGFPVSTTVLSVNFNLRRLYVGAEAMPDGGGLPRRFYELVYAPQDRLADRLVLHRPTLSTLRVFHNLGLATQHTTLAISLVLVALLS